MSCKEKILFIVEGKSLEPKIIDRMAQVYNINCKISSVATNIHVLYNCLKADAGFLEVVPVLKEIIQKNIDSLRNKTNGDNRYQRQIQAFEQDLSVLDENFTSIYLVFDSELQDRTRAEDGVVSDKCIAEQNCDALKEMITFFNNETEQGKLYINYPMMESFRHCNDFFDEGYKDRIISLDLLFGRDRLIKRYKQLVGQMRLANITPAKITKARFNLLIGMNVFKLNYITSGHWRIMTYDNFRRQSDQLVILSAQQMLINKRDSIAVINTLLFFLIDYLGRTFYNDDIKKISR